MVNNTGWVIVKRKLKCSLGSKITSRIMDEQIEIGFVMGHGSDLYSMSDSAHFNTG